MNLGDAPQGGTVEKIDKEIGIIGDVGEWVGNIAGRKDQGGWMNGF